MTKQRTPLEIWRDTSQALQEAIELEPTPAHIGASLRYAKARLANCCQTDARAGDARARARQDAERVRMAFDEAEATVVEAIPLAVSDAETVDMSRADLEEGAS